MTLATAIETPDAKECALAVCAALVENPPEPDQVLPQPKVFAMCGVQPPKLGNAGTFSQWQLWVMEFEYHLRDALLATLGRYLHRKSHTYRLLKAGQTADTLYRTAEARMFAAIRTGARRMDLVPHSALDYAEQVDLANAQARLGVYQSLLRKAQHNAKEPK